MKALDHVTEIYHASVRLKHKDVVVYIDPFHVTKSYEDAELIVITHAHGDHYSAEDVRKVMRDGTTFVAPLDVATKLQQDLNIRDEYIVTVQWNTPPVYFEDGVSVTPVIAENKNHPIDIGIGAVIEINGFRFYFSGDTDILAHDVKCDAVFIVCDGKYNMPEYETRAVEQVLAMDTMPVIAVPYHYGYIEDTAQNGKKLAAALEKAGIPQTLLY